MTVKTILIDEKTNAKLNDILTSKLKDASSTTSSGLIVGNVSIARRLANARLARF